MYRFYFLLVLIAFAASHCETAPATQVCKDVKSGRYRIVHENNESVTILSRSGDTQAEVREGEIDTSYWRVQWTGDCEFEMIYMDGDPTMPDSVKEIARATPVVVKILKVEKDYYTYTAEIKGLDFSKTDTAFNYE